jgi:hypothetical protein
MRVVPQAKNEHCTVPDCRSNQQTADQGNSLTIAVSSRWPPELFDRFPMLAAENLHRSKPPNYRSSY